MKTFIMIAGMLAILYGLVILGANLNHDSSAKDHPQIEYSISTKGNVVIDVGPGYGFDATGTLVQTY